VSAMAPMRGKLERGPNGFVVKAGPAPVPQAPPEVLQLVAEVRALAGMVQQLAQQVALLGAAMPKGPPVVNVHVPPSMPTPVNFSPQVNVPQQAPPEINFAPQVNVPEQAPATVNVEAPNVTVNAHPGEVRVDNRVESHVTADVNLPPPRARTATVTDPDGSVSEIKIDGGA